MMVQILLHLIPWEAQRMGLTINTHFKPLFFRAAKLNNPFNFTGIFSPMERKRRNLICLFLSRNCSKIIYNKNTGFSHLRGKRHVMIDN